MKALSDCLKAKRFFDEDNNITIWGPCNISDKIIIGKNINIGFGCEIGDNVDIGDNVRIGAQCFIPEGVHIGNNVWIGPACKFTNDRFPPSTKSRWEHIYINDDAVLGAAVIVLPGIIVGYGALIGAGSVITKSVSPNEIWAGVPAKKLRDKPRKYFDFLKERQS